MHSDGPSDHDGPSDPTAPRPSFSLQAGRTFDYETRRSSTARLDERTSQELYGTTPRRQRTDFVPRRPANWSTVDERTLKHVAGHPRHGHTDCDAETCPLARGRAGRRPTAELGAFESEEEWAMFEFNARLEEIEAQEKSSAQRQNWWFLWLHLMLLFALVTVVLYDWENAPRRALPKSKGNGTVH